MTDQTGQKKLSKQQAIAVERDLAKFANTMDSLVRIPFTKQGVGADAALSTIPFAGDVAGFILTLYAFKKAREVGVPQHKLKGVLKLAIMDMLMGFIPVVGTLFDVFIRPSRKTLEIVHEHIREEYQVYSDIHVVHPFLHESLEQKQKTSAFWRNPVVSWVWLRIPDLLGIAVLILLAVLLWAGFGYLWQLYQSFQTLN
ncbi:DUF4112 domain-containing protein [Acinetobacter tjernbergiae]|uniref:DUF4112 domain-containing protein n=1 Tax=Acinetobacter tjernbergiae DSM 14971 = CIP 107465 TaxID=1120928 RepID=V2V8Z7_9GAMM|nr:DUF4112 domain-containing protein [Acinetobacter tjernbergiae]ESK57370.1 hypothetical protein F990_00287 [Acinetobacter tjernbergiae DSM 14971 = CIP 107465]